MAVSIEALKADAELREALAHGCDFAFDEGGGGPDWFTIDGYEHRYDTFGHDGSGGIFAGTVSASGTTVASATGSRFLGS